VSTHHLKQQREATELAGPTGFDERDAAIGQPHPAGALRMAAMPEEAQVPVALGHSVIHGMRASHFRIRKRVPAVKSI